MEDSFDPSTPEQFVESVGRNDPGSVESALDRLRDAPAEDRKESIRGLRTLAEEGSSPVRDAASALVPFLEDEERAVRLATAKLLVVVAEESPGAVVPVASAVAARLADDEEFYYVRARCAEALGYVALEHPETVASPELLADLKLGLAFDEPEVREKLAKALEHVALGDPERLRHHAPGLADHLDDENELVRYHLCSTLVVVGSETPRKLEPVVDDLVERLEDPNPYVRGRAAEALGVVERDDVEVSAGLDDLDGEKRAFVAPRIAFATGTESGSDREENPLGTVASVRTTTEAIAGEVATGDVDGECFQCGLELPESGPPMCPRCGAPQ